MNNQNEVKGGVTFYEGPHTYENELGERYISVTTLIGEYKEKFDARKQAIESTSNPNSKYFGRTVEDVMQQWDQAGSDARVRGTHFHKGKEDDHIKQAMGNSNNSYIPNTKMIIPVENTGVMTDYFDLPDGEYSELILWGHKYKLAGIADKVIVDGQYFDIEDYKTNKSIDKLSFYVRGKGYKKMSWPLDHIMDCSFEHYQLQLSIYAYMFAELSGKTPRNLTILHHPTKDGVITQQETRYPVEYKKHDLMVLFNMRGTKKLIQETNQSTKLPKGL